MSEPFIGEIRMFSFGYPPKNWAPCNGQVLQISTNQALFALLGTTYGGDGRTTFGLPDLRGRVPLQFGPQYALGNRGGEASHTLTTSEIPQHTHTVMASGVNGDTPAPSNTAALGGRNNTYAPPGNVTTLDPASISNTGGSTGHENEMPLLTVSFCIALSGIWPPHN